MVTFREEIEEKPPFLIPFLLSMFLGSLGGVLMIWLRLAHDFHIGLLLLLIGALCGLGSRLTGGDFSSPILALFLVQSFVILTVGTVEIARELETSILSLILEVLAQGKFTGFINQCVAEFFHSLSVRSLVIAYPVAYGVYRIGKD